MNKRLLLLPVVAGIMALGLGAAAILPVTGGTLQQGGVSATCQTTAVDVGYVIALGEVTDVTVDPIDADCVTAGASITLDIDGTVPETTTPQPVVLGLNSVDIADVAIADLAGVTVTLD